MRDTGLGTGERGDVGVVHVDAVRHPHVLAEPAGRLEVVGRAHAEQFLAELLFLDGLRAVRVQAHTQAAGQLGALLQQLGGDREGGAGGDGDLGHRVEGRVVELLDGRLGVGESALEGLDGVVRRQAAVLLAAVHGAAGEGEADAHLGGGADDRAGEVAGALGEDVVVVHRGGHTALGHRGQGALRGRVRHLLVDARPGRVQRDEPVEEVVVGGQATRDPLVEVVVRVDQTGSHEVPGAVDAADDVLEVLGGLARADGLDLVAGDDHVTRGVLGVVRVDGRNRTVLDDDALDGAVRGCRCCHGTSSCFQWRCGHGKTQGI